MTSTTDASPTPPPAEPREAPATRRWHYWAAGAAAVLVALCTATAVALQPEAPPVPSRSEIALRSAHDDAARLTAAARASLEQAAAPELAPAARAALVAAATVLGRQTDVLGQATASQSPSGSPTSGSAGTTPAGMSPAGLLAELSASAQARLADVPDVDGPTATILASVAAGQVLQAESIAAGAGLHAPAPPGPAAATPADPTPAGCPSATRSAAPSATPTPAPTKPGAASAETNSAGTASAGPTSAGTSTAGTTSTGPLARPAKRLAFPDAIAAVARAESAAVYASQTALARSAAGSSEAATRASSLDAHRQQLKAVESLAARGCVGLPAPDAGFALPPGFAADPTPGLAAVAASGEESWAQLVGAAPAELRPWAAGGLLVAARLGTGSTPFPGVPSAG